jgi:hypothetical protein
LLHGDNFAKKLVASGNYFAILKREDGLVAFVWLNRFVIINLYRMLRVQNRYDISKMGKF